MTKKDDYKLNAARTVNLANRAATVADKGHLPDLAENGSILPIARMKCSSARSATKARRANILCCAASSAPTALTAGSRPCAASATATAGRPGQPSNATGLLPPARSPAVLAVITRT